MSLSDDDIENEIPVNNLQLSQGLSELRVKVLQRNEDGFIETRIERLKVQNAIQRQTCTATPFCSSRPVSNTISLSIEDVKLAMSQPDNCWKVYDCCFRRVLIYGKVSVLNQFSKSDRRTCYKFLVDDGSENIIATLNISKEQKVAVAAKTGRLTLERNKLKRKHEIGINIKGQFFPPDSPECQSVLNSISILQSMTMQNIKHQKKEFQLGPIVEKALILCNPYIMSNDQIHLNVIDMSFNDKIELAWKRQLNNLYLKEYLKKSKV